jgi:hypothetical protein
MFAASGRTALRSRQLPPTPTRASSLLREQPRARRRRQVVVDAVTVRAPRKAAAIARCRFSADIEHARRRRAGKLLDEGQREAGARGSR